MTTVTVPPWRILPPMDPAAFAALRQYLILSAYKWDPQVGDVSTLSSWPLVLTRSTWTQLAHWAEALSAESLAAEREMLARDDGPRFWKKLAIPWQMRRAFREGARTDFTPAAARVVRYDFHWTTTGWQISEANADVPGGYSEAGAFARRMAEHYPGTETTGDPSELWADVVARPGGVAALLSAPGYMEDHQVVSYLAARLRQRGMTTHLATPQQLQWTAGNANLITDSQRSPLDLIVRFYQAEWLPRTRGDWRGLVRGGRTPVTNPVTALLIESKRFPLIWDELHTPVPTWRALLPETRAVYGAPWRTDDGWLLKSALCNNGDTVSIRSCCATRQWRSASLSALLNPRDWIAQRRFEAVPLDTPDGPRFPCIGVYTVNGRAVGAYGRLATQPIVDYAAVDVAVLMEEEGVIA